MSIYWLQIFPSKKCQQIWSPIFDGTSMQHRAEMTRESLPRHQTIKAQAAPSQTFTLSWTKY